MNQEARSSWPHSIDGDSMAGVATDEDFTDFLQLDTDFSVNNLGDDRPHMNSTMEALDLGQLGLSASNGESAQGITGWDAPNAADDGQSTHNQANTSMSMFPEQGYHPSNSVPMRQPIIPPTPTSDDIHGGTAYYAHSGGYLHHGYNLHQQARADLNAFTPLVSPAVTPADLQLHMSEYVMSGEYFSPLASPAIEAEKSRERNNLRGNSSGSGTEPIPSPVDIQPDLSAFSAPTTPVLRKQRRKGAGNTRSTARNVRQSPIVKPQARKKRGSVNLSPVIGELVQKEYPRNTGKLSASGSGGSGAISSGSSAQDSVSPEPLSEALMPPPAAPRSAGRSPMIPASTKRSSMVSNEPATPATLMKLQAKPSASPTTFGKKSAEQNESQMEDLQLPEAATFTQSSAPGTNGVDDQVTPTILAKTPRLSGQMTPRARPNSSSGPSPQIEPMMSPKDPEPNANTKSGGPGRGGRKRQSMSSSQISPALRPKISPSIKPLIPQGGSISAETSALYLASKSNYQNIIEGTHLPGVSYPEALAENLSSKRTSHKIAEQGRRNRINTALKEIEALLPQSPTSGAKRDKDSNESADADKPGSANQSSSKANTVEMAIAYIKELREQVCETQAKLEVAEKRLAETNAERSESGSTSG